MCEYMFWYNLLLCGRGRLKNDDFFTSVWRCMVWWEQSRAVLNQNSYILEHLRKFNKFPKFLRGSGVENPQKIPFHFLPYFSRGEGVKWGWEGIPNKVYNPVNPNSYHPTLLSADLFTFSSDILLSFCSKAVHDTNKAQLHCKSWKCKCNCKHNL